MPTETVPSWNGELDSFEEYRAAVTFYVDGTERNKRSLCGPRLAGRLTGRAAAAVRGKRPGWLTDADGGYRLISYLYGKLCREPLPDLGRHMEEFFARCRRRKGETVPEWTIRFRDRYEKLRQALAR
eukprot:8292966-Alexandrium_andersonii.AAC.1